MKRHIFQFLSLFVIVLIGTSFIFHSRYVSTKELKVEAVTYHLPNDESKKWVEAELKKLTLRDRIAQSFMVACWSNRGEKHLSEIESLVREQKIGGLIFFQGERSNFQDAVQRMQQASDFPLLIGMDAEWGVSMRLFGEPRFPFQQTIGAANNLELTQKMGLHMGIESDMLGIHLNFSPVADVNTNPKNPVIGFRAFGSESESVSKQTAAMVRGIEQAGVISCLKHFPGHGDTDKDSHYELPTVSHTVEQFEKIDFQPFREGIKAGARSVMVAHLRVPSLDPSGTPSSLSRPIIQDFLRKKLEFNGLVISDALNMKAVSEKYGKSEVAAMAYQAGCDILLFPESVSEAIDLIVKKVEKGTISESEVNDHCRRILKAKYDAIVSKPQVKRMDPTPERKLITNQVYEKALVCLKNDESHLPIDLVDKKMIRVAVGTHTTAFRERLDDYADFRHIKFNTSAEAVRRLKNMNLPNDAEYIVDFHSIGQRAASNYGFGNWKDVIEALPSKAKKALVFFGNPLVFQYESGFSADVKSVLCAYENTKEAQERTAQAVMGAFDVKGKLPMEINETWKVNTGIVVKGNGRLKYSQAEELQLNPSKLAEIDVIVSKAIAAKAFPGCQVVVAIDGKIVIQKAYGTTEFERGDSITNEHIYDIASITKIASTTTALMRLQTLNQFNVNKTLGELVPEYVSGTAYANLRAENLLTHRAGLTPWIPFYKKMISSDGINSAFMRTEQEDGFSVPVANGLWIKNDYWKTMLKIIVETPLTGKKTYEYSDLSYYFFQRYIEKVSGKSQDQFVEDEIYKPLGLRTMTYLPLKKFPIQRIVPTEYDKEFRKQLVRGYVHDPGAAMMGGVAGHAGLFSNATDLAALMQFLLNKGQVGDQSVINEEVVEQYTACQFCPENRRGLGFDKPTVNLKNGPTCELVSPSTFGHSGFTGTITWADPVNKVNYVFLSNRVCPDAENWKITKMSVRNEIQRVIYEVLNEARQK